MNEISLSQYRKDPCGTLSIPYYKAKRVSVPEGMLIVHERDFDPEAFAGYSDEPYFRLIHRMSDIRAPESETFRAVTAGERDIPLISEIIARSYRNVRLSEESLLKTRSSAGFDPALWVIAYEKSSGRAAACGIAELDGETREASLEWIQTLPGFRRMGAGRLVVSELLSRLAGKAEFTTVSGKLNDPYAPERLYRACGFAGNDIWHVLRKG